MTDFEFICGCLSLDRSHTSLLEDALDDRDWDRFIRFADEIYLLPAFYLALKRRELLSCLDKEVQDFFEGIYELNSERNRRIKEQSIELIRILNSKNIVPVLLKGVAGLIDGLYEDDGERIMSDIDILIYDYELSEAVKILMDNGYSYFEEPSKYDLEMKYKHHAPALFSAGLPASVELHIRPTILVGTKTLLDIAYAHKDARPICIEGSQALVPSPEFRLLHNFFHSEHQDGRNFLFGRFHLRGFQDWIRIRQVYDPMLDWLEMAQRVRKHHLNRSFSAYLINARDYFNQPIHESVSIDCTARWHVLRQQLLIKYVWVAQVNNLVLTIFRGLWNFFSPTLARRNYGDVSFVTAARLRIGKLVLRYFSE